MNTLKVMTGVVLIGLLVIVATSGITTSADKNYYEPEPTMNSSYRAPDSEQDIRQSITTAGYDIGDVAAGFKLKDVSGKMVTLSDYNDEQGVVVIFTCNHCPYSKAYEDRIIAIDQKYKGAGYPVVAINPNNPADYPEDSYENMKVRAQEKGFTFPYLFDQGQHVYPKYGATKTPHVYLLNREDGNFVVRYIGAIDDNYKDAAAVKNTFLEDAINALIQGREVRPATTKAIGCSIKA